MNKENARKLWKIIQEALEINHNKVVLKRK